MVTEKIKFEEGYKPEERGYRPKCEPKQPIKPPPPLFDGKKSNNEPKQDK